jgi:hypothetical protein
MTHSMSQFTNQDVTPNPTKSFVNSAHKHLLRTYFGQQWI